MKRFCTLIPRGWYKFPVAMQMSHFSEFLLTYSRQTRTHIRTGLWLGSLLLVITVLTGCSTTSTRDQNALVSAAALGDTDKVTQLLGDGANPDVHLQDGTTALFMAAQQGHTKTVELLLNAGANPNLKGYKGATPLIIAASVGHKGILDLLLKKGAVVDASRDDKSTALYMAAQSGYINIVRQLLEAGADVNKRAYKNATPLFIAAQIGHHTIVEELAKKGADVNVALSNGTTPLIAAALKGHVSVTNILLAYGADITHKNQRGEDAMKVAQQEVHPELLAILKNAEARLLEQNKLARAETAISSPVKVQPDTTRLAEQKMATPLQAVKQPLIQATPQAKQSAERVTGKTRANTDKGRQAEKNRSVASVSKVKASAAPAIVGQASTGVVVGAKTARSAQVVKPAPVQSADQVSTSSSASSDKKPVATAGRVKRSQSIADLIQQQGKPTIFVASAGLAMQEHAAGKSTSVVQQTNKKLVVPVVTDQVNTKPSKQQAALVSESRAESGKAVKPEEKYGQKSISIADSTEKNTPVSIADLIQQQITSMVDTAGSGPGIDVRPVNSLASVPKLDRARTIQQVVASDVASNQDEEASPPVVLALARPVESSTTIAAPVAENTTPVLAASVDADALPVENQSLPESGESDTDDSEFNNDPSAFGWSAERFLRSVDEMSQISQGPPQDETPARVNQPLTQAEQESRQPLDGTYLYSVDDEADEVQLKQTPDKKQLASDSVTAAARAKIAMADPTLAGKGREKSDQISAVEDEAPQAGKLSSGTRYRMALVLIRDKQYKLGEQALEEFLVNYPGDNLEPSARYWASVAAYAQGKYKQAASKFLAFYKQYPQHDKAAEALLNLARSLSALGKDTAACTTIQKLKKEYPAALARMEDVVNSTTDRVCP